MAYAYRLAGEDVAQLFALLRKVTEAPQGSVSAARDACLGDDGAQDITREELAARVIKSEGGFPGIRGVIESHRHFGDEDIYWQLHPARRTKSNLAATLNGGAFNTRQAWEFQGCLQGDNDDPLRRPAQRIHDGQMTALRKGLIDAGLQPTTDPFREFFIGRHPA
ncbi:hypothetical protein AB0M25_19930 [Streptomyces griseomycini]|uniref:hypothetical protein n=1 Tax=Streptomyces griseomycini TaxID=66895 RepID=UPI00344AD25F